MLVLSRTRDQSIMIGDEIEVRVVDIRGDKVRIGINAPRTTSVHRKEIYDTIRGENVSASEMTPGDLLGSDLPRGGVAPMMRLVRPPSESELENGMPDEFLQAAIDEAKKGLSEGGLPIGSVLVRDGKIIGRGHNKRVQNGDPMAHAEIDCLTNAGRQKSYKDTVLYSTLMPCYLCTGAVLQFGIPKVIVGESVNFPGGEGGWGKSPKFMAANGVEVIDLHDATCIEMMSEFIKAKPELWNEDIGV